MDNPFSRRYDDQTTYYEKRYGPIILKVLKQLSQARFGNAPAHLLNLDLSFPVWSLWKRGIDQSVKITIHKSGDKYVMELILESGINSKPHQVTYENVIIDLKLITNEDDFEKELILGTKKLLSLD